jgi:hypothetical protein
MSAEQRLDAIDAWREASCDLHPRLHRAGKRFVSEEHRWIESAAAEWLTFSVEGGIRPLKNDALRARATESEGALAAQRARLERMGAEMREVLTAADAASEARRSSRELQRGRVGPMSACAL